MRNIKYVCFGGSVYGRDGDVHHISKYKIPSLYGVNPKECIFAETKGLDWVDISNLIKLYPDESGRYILKTLLVGDKNG